MGCATNIVLSGIDMSCDTPAYGGLTEILLANKEDLNDVSVDNTTGVVTVGTIASGKVVELSFHNKDNFTKTTDKKVTELTGTVKVDQQVEVEFPLMDAAKRLELDKMATPFAKLVCFTTEATGIHKMYGFEFGLVASVEGDSGAGRGDKNVYKLTLTGEENHLAYVLDDTAYTAVKNAIA